MNAKSDAASETEERDRTDADRETPDPPGGAESLEPDPDGTLVQAAAKGDHRAFEQLVLRHQDRVYTRIYFMVHDREMAADLCQEAFLKVHTALGTFRREARFSTWLHRIAVNVTLHHFEKSRAQKRSARVQSLSGSVDASGADLEIADPRQIPSEWAERNECQRAILEAVAQLAPDYRTALTLREIHGFSYRDIEGSLGIPIGTVKSKIFRARQILQEKLKNWL